uniref:Uncharacterized protein n=1 Tax=Fagus sylvatica TaxID=28930 RepID=A0A2N9GTY6_FAGSY
MVSEPSMANSSTSNGPQSPSPQLPSPLMLLSNMSNLISIKLDNLNYMKPSQYLVDAEGNLTTRANPSFFSWKKRDKALLTPTYLTLSPPVLSMVVGLNFAQEVWSTLETRFTSTARANVLNLKLELQSVKKGTDSINVYMQQVKTVKDKFSIVGVQIDDEEMLHMVLKGLPKEYSSFNSAIRTRDDSLTFEKLSVLLQTEEISINESSEINSTLAISQGSPSQGAQSAFHGQNSNAFNKPGHNRPTCQICGKVGRYAINCYHRMDFAYQGKNPPTKLAAMANASNLNITQGTGYPPTTKGYLCQDPITKKLYISRHVLFNETEFPALEIPTPSQSSTTKSYSSDSWFTHLLSTHTCTSLSYSPCLNSTSPSHNSTSPLSIDQALAPQSFIDPSIAPILTSDIQPAAGIQSPGHASAVDSFHNQPPVIPAPQIPHISPTISNSHPMQTRSKHGILKPKTCYKAQLDYTLTKPPTFKIATQIYQWCQAMQDEYDELIRQGTWSLVSPPTNHNIVGCKWAYKLKTHSDGSIARYKARLVAKGFHQQQNIDFDETFSPVIKPPTGTRDSTGLNLSQAKYATALLHKHNMFHTKPISTPCTPNTRLSLHDGAKLPDPHAYRSLVEALHYLTFIRPNLSFAVHQVYQYMASPTSVHLMAAKRILSPNPITWSAKKQLTMSRSSTKSEYRALALASAELCWLQTLLKDLGVFISATPILWCDNISALAIAFNPVFHARTKHKEVDFHFVRERVLRKDLAVKFVSTLDQLANIFTKSLPTHRFLDLHINRIATVRPPELEEGC